MANNNNLFNAVIAGAGGSNQQRWITANRSSDYTAYQVLIENFATAIDAAIEPIDGDANIAQTALMQGVSGAVFANRLIQTTGQANYEPIINAIVALYASLETALLPPTGGGGGTIAPLSVDYWTDPNTLVPVESQTGAISAPFSTLQAAYDAFGTETRESRSTILLIPTIYTGDVENTAGIDIAFQGIGGGTIEGNLIGTSADETWTFNQVRIEGNITTEGVVRFSKTTLSGLITCSNILADLESSIDTLEASSVSLKDGTQCSICNVTVNLVLTNGSQATLCDGDTTGNLTAQWSSLASATNFSSISCEYCNVGNLQAFTIALQNCRITPGAVIDCEFLAIDSITYQRALLDGCTFVNLAANGLTISDGQLKATLSIAVPAIATATDVTYVNTTLTGVLANLFAVGDAVTVNPQADIPGAGACIASARISAANTLRVGFRGVTTGGAMNFTVARPG